MGFISAGALTCAVPLRSLNVVLCRSPAGVEQQASDKTLRAAPRPMRIWLTTSLESVLGVVGSFVSSSVLMVAFVTNWCRAAAWNRGRSPNGTEVVRA